MDTTHLTDQQLATAARNYDLGMNEGGEGYNPYRVEIERREDKREAARPITRSDRKYRIIHELNILDCSIARESGTYNAERIATLRAAVAAIEAEEAAEFLAAWPLDVTVARRAEWNARVRAGEFGKLPNVSAMLVSVAVEKQGWNLADLKAAIKLHNLPKA